MFDDEYSANDFFADADYADIDPQEFDFDLPEGTHFVIVAEAGPHESKAGNKSFRIRFVGDKKKSFTQWFNPIMPGDAEKPIGDTNLAQIKRQERVNVLTAIGVPRDHISRLKPEELVGVEGYLKISKDKKDRMRFRGFTATGTASAPSTSRPSETVTIPDAVRAPENLSEFGI